MPNAARWMMVAPLLLGGCASGLPGARPLTYATPGEARVFATGDRCVHDPAGDEAAGLIAAVLTGAASQLLKGFGTALSEGAKGGALPSSTATLNLQLDPGAMPKCIVIIRGAFDPRGKTVTPLDNAAFLSLTGEDAEKRTRLASLGLPHIYRIDHYVELRVENAANGKALTFAPIFLRLANSIDGARKGERDLSVAVKFNRAGADPVGSVVVIADRQIGSTSSWPKPATNVRYPIEAPWFGSPHPASAPAGTTAAANAAAVAPAPAPVAPSIVGSSGSDAGGGGQIAPAPAGPGGSIVPMQSTSKHAVPITLTTTVVETRPTNEGLAFVATLFNAVEPKIEEKLKPLIDSSARRTAEAAEESASLGVQADYAAAEGTARAALVGYCLASSTESTAAGKQDRITKSKDARSAQLKANVAAIKAEIDQPYKQLVIISDGLPTTMNASVCSGL